MDEDVEWDLLGVSPATPIKRPPLPAPLYSLRRESPYRPVDWRYQMAHRLWDKGRPPTQRDVDGAADVDIAAQLRLLVTIDETPTEWALQEELYDKDPDLGEAYQLYTTTHVNAVGARWELEARLLCANETLESIAKKTGLRLGTVQWYEKFFYNVRDRLNNLSYLRHHALGHRVRAGIDEPDIETLWKVAALYGGAHWLDEVMHPLTPTMLDDPKCARRYNDTQFRDLVARQALIAGLTLGTRDASTIKLMALNAKNVEAENILEGHAGSPNDDAPDGLQMVIDRITINFPKLTEKSQVPPGVLSNRDEEFDAELAMKMGLPVGAKLIPEFPCDRGEIPVEPEPDDPVDPADREELD